MESVSLRLLILATLQKPNPKNPFANNTSRFRSQSRRSQSLPVRSKQSNFQDFQNYAKPLNLLQAEKVIVFTDNLEDEVLSCCSDGVSRSLYKVVFRTSRYSGSSISDINAGVLLCLIDENGDAILQRIPASLVRDRSADSENDSLNFQTGSLDEFTFEGPRLGRVKAMWIGLESGQWRLEKVSLTVICGCQPSLEEKSEGNDYTVVKYEFEAADFQLGEGSNKSMLELRPCLVTEKSGADPSTLLGQSLPESASLEIQQISNEESMREYANLKLSLLLYDAVLVLVGASAASFTAGEHAGFAFLGGGIGGFLYLLVLQRSVDGLPASELSSQNTGTIGKTLGGFKVPISSVALVIGFTLCIIKYSSGDFRVVFTAKDLVLGMLGFLACKVSVVLAAFKPLPRRSED